MINGVSNRQHGFGPGKAGLGETRVEQMGPGRSERPLGLLGGQNEDFRQKRESLNELWKEQQKKME